MQQDPSLAGAFPGGAHAGAANISYCLVKFRMVVCVKWKTTAKTTAWVAATTNFPFPGGSETRTPGVRIKNNAAMARLMRISNNLYRGQRKL